MLHPNVLQHMFNYNAILIRRQSALLTNEDSLVPMDISEQCYNWLLGHIVSARTFALRYLGETHTWTDNERQRYQHGARGLFSVNDPPPFTLSTLLDVFEETQKRLENGLANTTYEALCQSSDYQSNSVGDSLAYFHFHEAHHVGQLMYLAKNVGKSGVWL